MKHRRRLTRLGFLILILSNTVFANAVLKRFNQRFEVLRVDSKPVAILSKNSRVDSLALILEKTQEELTRAQKRWQQSSFVDERKQFLRELERDLAVHAKGDDRLLVHVRRGLEEIETADLDDLLKNRDWQAFWEKFKQAYNELFYKVSPRTVAVLGDPLYFPHRTRVEDIATFGMRLAGEFLGHSPLFGLAQFFVFRANSYYRQQRSYAQNLLVAYLMNMDAGLLGLSELDVNHAVSSVYSTQVHWADKNAKAQLEKNWDRYGMLEFYALQRAAKQRVLLEEKGELSQSDKLHFAFAYGPQQRKIYHLLVNKHRYSTSAALAFDPATPHKILTYRVLLVLAEMGVGLLPIPSVMRREVYSFLGSLSYPQVDREAFLVGFFETTGNLTMAKKIERQHLNPLWRFIPLRSIF